MKQLYVILISLLTCNLLIAQVGINNDNPDPAAILDIESESKGVLFPRVINIQSIEPSTQSLMVYDYESNNLMIVNENLKWETVQTWEASYPGELKTDKKVEIKADLNVINGNINTTGSATIGNGINVSNGNVTVNSPGTLKGFGTVPLGGIIMWSGDTNTIPAGWKLCDGRQISVGVYTPDLRGRFIVGYGTSNSNRGSGEVNDSVWDTRYKTIRASGSSKKHKLDINNLPEHGHSPIISSTDKHSHGIKLPLYYYPDMCVDTKKNGFEVANTRSKLSNEINEEGAHKHVISENKTFNNNPYESRPAYYVLAFIMRVQ